MPFDPQVYRLASIARDKLCREAAKASHDLRALVAHANLLDELLVELNAPGGASTDYYGFELLPLEVRTERAAPRPVVVTVKEGGELELDDGEHSRPLSSDSSQSLPMLTHDLESESDSASDSDESDDSDDSDDFDTVITTPSPTDSSSTSLSSVDDEEPDESDLELRRTKSAWRLFSSTSPSSKELQKQKSTTSVDTITNDVERLRLLTS